MLAIYIEKKNIVLYKNGCKKRQVMIIVNVAFKFLFAIIPFPPPFFLALAITNI